MSDSAKTAPAAPAVTDETRAASPASAAPAVDLRAERERSSAIMALGARHSISNDVVQRAINDGMTLDAFRGIVLDEIAKTEPARAIAPGGAMVSIVHPGESPAERSAAMVDGIIMRALGHAPDGQKGKPKVDNAERSREFAGMSLLEMAAETMGMRNAHRIPNVRLYDDIAQRSAMGTTDFPLLLSAAANKFLLAQYQYQEPSYRKFAAQKTFNDFKAHNFLRVGDFPVLQQLAETGEFRNGSISENREQVYALTYGRIVNLSRQMFVNDDLSAFADLAGMAGRRISDFENSVAWGLILSASKAGPTLSDTGALFNTTAVTTAGGHANLAASGASISITSIDAGTAAMMQQKSLDGIPLNTVPRVLVVGPQKRTEALQLLSGNLLATQISNINVFNTGLELAVDAYISDKAWYMFADPMVAPTFVYGYVSGYNGPRFTIDQPFRYDGLALKVAEDFGFGAVDFRGAYRNPGA